MRISTRPLRVFDIAKQRSVILWVCQLIPNLLFLFTNWTVVFLEENIDDAHSRLGCAAPKCVRQCAEHSPNSLALGVHSENPRFVGPPFSRLTSSPWSDNRSEIRIVSGGFPKLGFECLCNSSLFCWSQRTWEPAGSNSKENAIRFLDDLKAANF
jgi:hypothetical protein